MSNETVEKDCKHKGCIYRKQLGLTEACMYAVIENKPRGCKISECDKYKIGQPRKPRIKYTTEIWWEYEVIENDKDDII